MAGGTLTPIILAASKIVVPAGTSIEISSIVTFGKAAFNLNRYCNGFGAAKLGIKKRIKKIRAHIFLGFCKGSVPLFAATPRSFLVAGFPLQSGADKLPRNLFGAGRGTITT